MSEPRLASVPGELRARQRMLTGWQWVAILVAAALVDAALCAVLALA